MNPAIERSQLRRRDRKGHEVAARVLSDDVSKGIVLCARDVAHQPWVVHYVSAIALYDVTGRHGERPLAGVYEYQRSAISNSWG